MTRRRRQMIMVALAPALVTHGRRASGPRIAVGASAGPMLPSVAKPNDLGPTATTAGAIAYAVKIH